MLFIPESIREQLREETADNGAQSFDVHDFLKKAGLRPTRQRMILCSLLFSSGHRHITADDLYRDIIQTGFSLSLATIYNTLNQLVSAGLLRRIAIPGERTYYDTDPGSHHHFFIEKEQKVIDIPANTLHFRELPAPPQGYAITHVEVIIRLRRIGQNKNA